MLAELVAPALLGAATGLRSQVGVAALLSRRDFTGLPRPLSLLGTLTVRTASQLSAVGELIGDKLRAAPPRTEPGPLTGRVAFGAFAGVLVDVSRHGRFRGASAGNCGVRGRSKRHGDELSRPGSSRGTVPAPSRAAGCRQRGRARPHPRLGWRIL